MKVTKDQIQNIFDVANLGLVEKMEVQEKGFTNEIVFVNNEYVLKIATKTENEENIEREAFLLNKLRDILPIPSVIFSDFSKKIIPNPYLILSRLEGVSLYEKWGSYKEKEREETLLNIIKYLRLVNSIDTSEIKDNPLFTKYSSWKEFQTQEFNKSITVLGERKVLDKETIENAKVFWDANIQLLGTNRDTLCYWDIHFDNFLIDENNNIGMLDFESTDIMSIDYPMLIVKNLSMYPKDYVSESMESVIENSDYQNIYNFFRTEYSEAFSFNNMDTRIALYSLAYDLKILCDWPKAEDRKERIRGLSE